MRWKGIFVTVAIVALVMVALRKSGVVGREQFKKFPKECKINGNPYGSNKAKKGGVSRKNVRATYHQYFPNYETSTLSCSDIFWKWKNYGKTLLRYPWAAYCVTKPWNREKDCGRCLRVTNRGTGASVIVRAVDQGGCTDAKDGTGLDLDPCAFNAIDTNKHGVRDGNMRVDVQEVDCLDPPK